MKAKLRQDKAWLLVNAKTVATELKRLSEGTLLRIRPPQNAAPKKTGGWRALLGNLGRGQPRLEIWFDCLTGYPERKFYAGFFAPDRPKITAIIRRVERRLWPIRTMGSEDLTRGNYERFKKRLRPSEFDSPVLERYSRGRTYFGIFDPTHATKENVNSDFCNRAVAFFQDVVRALPNATQEEEQHEVYPQYENRRRVASHLRRDRSGFLATQCKIRDNYKCQVCRFRFDDGYGMLGRKFAEAHHRVPPSKLRENVRTKLEDLATVCANCHRMLHRMAGEHDDVKKLRAIVRKRRGWRI
jgi:5-methylcytosine-specific restriction endonuclease McrA